MVSERRMPSRASTPDEGGDLAAIAARAVYDAFTQQFPGRMRAGYAEGSLADGSRLATSDVDLIIVFADGFHDEDERRQAEALALALNREARVELDVTVTDEAALARGVRPALKLAGRLIAGTDVLPHFPLIAIDQWARERMHAAYWLTIKVHGRPEIVRPPLAYPDPADEFFGYLRRTIRLPDGRSVLTTRDLLRTTGWAATALLAQRAGQYVARKRDCHVLYRRHIGGAHAALLDDLYTLCRERWRYRIPDDPGERAILRAICRRTLAFENDFLAAYTPYLLAELRAAQRDGTAAETLRQPLRILREVPLADADVVAALDALARAADYGGR